MDVLYIITVAVAAASLGFYAGYLRGVRRPALRRRPAERAGSEKQLLRNALELRDLKVRDCMVPRIDIEAVDKDIPMEELVKRFAETEYSRLLVYDGTIDNVVGYITSKSLFADPQDVGGMLKRIDHVAETLPAQKMLSMFIKRKSALAVVIDEFGGTSGIVSLEDILEEIFGEIEDEHDAQDMIERETGADEYVFSCRLEIDHLNEKYALGLPESEQYNTLAGYILANSQGIPKPGEVLRFDGMEIRILRTSPSRIELVRVKKSAK